MPDDPGCQCACAFDIIDDLTARVPGQYIGSKQHELAIRINDAPVFGDNAQTITIAVEGKTDFSIGGSQRPDDILQIFRY